MKDNKGILIFDLDGTICPIKSSSQKYEDLVPYNSVVELIRKYHNEGYIIKIFTARNMKTHSANIGLINKHTAPIVLKWLEKWNIPHDEIIFGKPWPGDLGFYIDDRAVRPDEFVKYSIEELQEIVDKVQDNLKV